MTREKLSLKEWTRRIGEKEMPVFAYTARAIAAASTQEETPIAELAQQILRDSAMTARILRLANSVYYNPGGRPVNTISRAIVFLGFNVVRSMAITIAIMEPLLKGVQHEHALEEMARSFHAAVQARTISQARGNEDAEEVFVAALLTRLGHMAFWCFPYDHDKLLDQAYQEWDDRELAEEEVLGFSLTRLSLALNKEWGLSELLDETLTGKNPDDPQNRDVLEANELVLAAEEGWGSIRTKTIIDSIARRLHVPRTEIEPLVEHGAYEAAQAAVEYGAVAASQYIPLPVQYSNNDTADSTGADLAKPDINLQMRILRELTTMLHERVDINAILGTIMEGIYRALGMERTVIAFVSGSDNILSAKYILGDDKDKLKRCFAFAVGPGQDNLFSKLLNERQALWFNSKSHGQYEKLLSKEIKQCLGVLDFFAMPIWIGNKGKGIIYADCKRSGRKLSQEEFQTFGHFSEYATIAFDLMAVKK